MQGATNLYYCTEKTQLWISCVWTMMKGYSWSKRVRSPNGHYVTEISSETDLKLPFQSNTGYCNRHHPGITLQDILCTNLRHFIILLLLLLSLLSFLWPSLLVYVRFRGCIQSTKKKLTILGQFVFTVGQNPFGFDDKTEIFIMSLNSNINMFLYSTEERNVWEEVGSEENTNNRTVGFRNRVLRIVTIYTS